MKCRPSSRVALIIEVCVRTSARGPFGPSVSSSNSSRLCSRPIEVCATRQRDPLIDRSSSYCMSRARSMANPAATSAGAPRVGHHRRSIGAACSACRTVGGSKPTSTEHPFAGSSPLTCEYSRHNTLHASRLRTCRQLRSTCRLLRSRRTTVDGPRCGHRPRAHLAHSQSAVPFDMIRSLTRRRELAVAPRTAGSVKGGRHSRARRLWHRLGPAAGSNR